MNTRLPAPSNSSAAVVSSGKAQPSVRAGNSGQAVLNLHGTLDYFIENTFNYPTLAEAYKIAALDAWNRLTPRKEAVAEVTAAVP